MSIVIITNVEKIPKELKGFSIRKYNADQFISAAYSEEGIDIDDGDSVWYHTTILNQEILNQLQPFIESFEDFVFYRFNTDPATSFDIDEHVCEDPDAAPAPAAPAPKQEPTINPETTFSGRPGSTYSEPVVYSKPEESAQVETPAAPEAPITPIDNPHFGMRPEVTTTETPSMPTVEKPIFNIPQINIPAAPTIPQIQTPVEQPKVEQPVAEQPVTPQQPVITQQPTAPQIQIPQIQIPSAPQAPVQPSAPTEHHTIGGTKLVIANPDISNTGGTIIAPGADGLLEETGDIAPKVVEGNGAEVIIFGSSKGGTGKTFTACMSAYQFSKEHPNIRVAFADFDIIDGQVSITTNQVGPTVQGFYTDYLNGKRTFSDLFKYKANTDQFSRNIDFYLAPAQDIPEITNDDEFWKTIYNLLIQNYDVVFFDTGIDYMGKTPISDLYKVADKIIITCNTSINSVKSIIKQILTLSGKRPNNVFDASDDIISRINIVLTRVSDEYEDVNELVVNRLSRYAPIIAAFGNIDGLIYKVQWGGTWNLIDEQDDILDNLRRITDLSGDA